MTISPGQDGFTAAFPGFCQTVQVLQTLHIQSGGGLIDQGQLPGCQGQANHAQSLQHARTVDADGFVQMLIQVIAFQFLPDGIIRYNILSELKEQLTADWMAARQRELSNKAYEELRKRYRVLVEGMPYDTDMAR